MSIKLRDVMKILGYRPQPCVDMPSRITLEMAAGLARALRDEQAGKSVVMRDPKIKPKPPRKPSWE